MNTSFSPFPAPSDLAPTPGQTPQPRRHLGKSSFCATWLVALLFFGLLAPSARAQAQPPGCTGSGLGILLFTDSLDVHIGDTLNYSVTVFNGADTGPLVCDATDIQAFVVTPDGVSHPITLRRTALINGQSDYYANVVSYVVRSQDIQPDDTVRATARDTGVIHQNDTPSQGGGNQGVNTEVSRPCIKLAAQCVGSVGENGAISFTGTVSNCGNNTLVGVTVTNFVNNGAFTVVLPTNLLGGQVATFSGTWIPADPCNPSLATLVAQGVDRFTQAPRTVTSSTTTTCAEVLTPGLKVTNICPVDPVSPGQLLVFSGSVSNTGNITLRDIVVVTDQPTANTPVFTLAFLAPGGSANFTGSYAAPTNCTTTHTLTARASTLCAVPVAATASATCPIFTSPAIVVTAVCPATALLPGGVLTYTGTVQNTGNTPLVNVVVRSDRPVANSSVFAVASLAPGASANFSGAYTVPVGACSVTTTFSAIGKDNCTPNTVTNSVATTCAVTTAPAIAVTLLCPSVASSTGGSIAFSGTVRNSGNVTLNNVFVVNNQPGTNSPVVGPLTLAPGAVSAFVARFDSPADACSVSSTVTASGNDSCTSVLVSSSASATCALITTPKIAITQNCPVDPVIPGSFLTYSGSVSNAGNVTLTNIVVVNNLSGAAPVFTAPTLAPGSTLAYTGSYLAVTNCSTASISTVTGQSICGVPVTGSASATCSIITSPQIAVTAVCPPNPVLPGGTLVYSGTVQNTGNTPLVNVVVVSDRPAANTAVFNVASLAPGASAKFTGSYVVPANACSVTTTFSAMGKDTCAVNLVTNSVSTTCTVLTAPAVAVTLACPAVPVAAGSLISYSGTIRNTGNVTLVNATVLDNQAVPSTVLNVASLAPGASANFTASFIAPADACSVSSTVTAAGFDSCAGTAVSATASAVCPLVTSPKIVVTQSCPANPPNPGGVLAYTGTVSNAGDVTLTNVVVSNNLSGAAPVFTAATLAPGAIASFTGSYLAPTNCTTASTSTATARSICGVAVTGAASSSCSILTEPALLVTQSCPPISVAPGGILKYSGVVSNTGNITLTNVVVVNDRTGSTPVLTVAVLAPGAAANFTGSYVTHGDCCLDSSTVTATGHDTCTGALVTDTATKTCPLLTSPKIVVTKTCPTRLDLPGTAQLSLPGAPLTYSGTVSNAGNITLINVTVVNDYTGPAAPVVGPIVLAAGQSLSFTGSYVVGADFCGTDTVTALGNDLCSGATVTNSVRTTCPIQTLPKIAVTKNCPIQPTALGGLYTYTGAVSNPGNVTLVNVYVFDDQPTNNTPVLGPITLAPGASVPFSGSAGAPDNCCNIVDTVTARGQDFCSAVTVHAQATAVCTLLTTPAITIVKHCPAPPLPAGGFYSFTGSITNTGDVVLTNVFVYSSQPGPNTLLLGPIELAPGESEDFSGSYNVAPGANPAADIVTVRASDVCQARNISARADCNGPVQLVAPRILSVTTTNGLATITWNAAPGATYALQTKSRVQDAWASSPAIVVSLPPTASTQTGVGTNTQRFYRVVIMPE